MLCVLHGPAQASETVTPGPGTYYRLEGPFDGVGQGFWDVRFTSTDAPLQAAIAARNATVAPCTLVEDGVPHGCASVVWSGPYWGDANCTAGNSGWYACAATATLTSTYNSTAFVLGWRNSVDVTHNRVLYYLLRAISSDSACPANSSWNGAQCICDEGYAANSTATQCVPATDVPYASAPPPPECEVCKGNPIYPLRGVKREEVDTGLAIGNTTLRFTYDNASRIPTASGALTDIGAVENRAGVMGSLQWVSNLHRQVTLFTIGAGSTPGLPVPTVFPRGNGVVKTMTSTDGGPRVGEPGNKDRFVQLPGGEYVYTDSGSNVQETYTASSGTGVLTTMAWADGTRIDFTYGSTGGIRTLSQVSDNRGRRLSFGYTLSTSGVPRVSSITDATGQVTTLSHDSRNNLVGITWADGKTQGFVYENTELPWALTGVIDERGLRYSTFGYDAQGRAISTEHAGGVDKYTVSYTTPPSIQVTKQTFGDAVARFHTWNLPQGMVMTEPSGQTTTWSAISLNGKNYFSAQGQQPGAGSLASSRSQTYDANGNIASRDDFNGTRRCDLNDLTRNLQTVSVTSLGTSQDCAAVTATNATLPAGALKTSTQWHPDWSLPTKVAAPGRMTTYVYHGQPDPFNANTVASCAPTAATLLDGQPITALCKQVTQATTDADGHLGFAATRQAGTTDTVQTWTYDVDGRVLTASTASGTSDYLRAAQTTADHTLGDLLSITSPSGEVTRFDRHDRYGQVLQSTSPDGTVTTYTYDLRQRMLSRTVGDKTTAYAYDAAGLLTKVTLPDGSWIGYEYDDAHRVVAVTDKKGNRIDYVLDNAGNRTDQRVKDPAGELTQVLNRLMDALGREQQAGVTDAVPASQVAPSLPTSPLPLERYEYDAQGNRTQITRGAGTLNLVTRLSYDALERVKDTTDPKNGTTRFAYDGGSRTTQVTDPRNLSTQYPRNGFGDATQVISPDTGTENLTYDASRNLKTSTDSRGVLTTYGYDASDRLTVAVATKSGQPTEAVSLTYSQTGAGFSHGVGRLTSSGYPGGSAQYGYDDQGEITSDLQRVDAVAGGNATQLTQTVVYSYTLGNLTGVSYPSGRQLGLSWVDGEVTGLTLGGNALVTQIEWTPFAGTVKRWRWAMAGGEIANERYYDLAGRAVRYPLGELLRDVRYDEASRIVSFTHLSANGTAQPALDQAFGYDENSRLTGITTPTASWGIGYDANGNRTGISLNGSLSAYSVEATSNRTTSITNPARSFGYDSAGNTTTDSEGYTATYNLRGQLATLTKAGVTTSYTYNAAGQRVRKVSSTGAQSTVVFAYDQAGHVLGEYDQNGAALREYVWLRDTPMAMFTPDPANPAGEPLVFFIHTDHLNTPRVVVDRQNRVRWRWLAEPFGTTAPETNPSGLGVFTQNLRFPGQYADQESGLVYNYHRYYDQKGGRYSQSDPIGLAAGSLSTYGYVDGNPLSYVDPLGLAATALSSPAGGGPRGGCDCGELKRGILRKYALLLAELRAYDPVLDGRGGFPMRGGKLTKPGGHYQEINDLRQGIKNDIDKYNTQCKDRDDGDGGAWAAIPRSIDRDANRPVAEPVIQPPPNTTPFWLGVGAIGIGIGVVTAPQIVVPALTLGGAAVQP
nr:RHS repeat-associated core domain-containing protein [Rhizobacter sp. SG703]